MVVQLTGLAEKKSHPDVGLFCFWKILQIFLCLNNFLAAFCHWMFSKTIKLHILYLAGAFLLCTEKLAAFSGGIEDLLSEQSKTFDKSISIFFLA